MKVAKSTAAPATPGVEDFIEDPPTPVRSIPNCESVENPDGSITVMLRIDPIRAKRIHTRPLPCSLGLIPLGNYL
jgi:carbon monoxide dehydrogenase subunit G